MKFRIRAVLLILLCLGAGGSHELLGAVPEEPPDFFFGPHDPLREADYVAATAAGLRSDDAGARMAAAARALQMARDLPPELLTPLFAGLRDPDEGVRLACCVAAAELGPNAEPAVGALTANLAVPSLTAAAARALGAIGPAAAPALPQLAKAAGSADVRTAVAARAAIVMITGEPGEHVEYIMRVAAGEQGEDLAERVAAIRSLGAMGGAASGAVQLLAGMVDGGPEIGQQAVLALGRIGAEGETAVPALLSLLRPPRREDDATVRRAVLALRAFPGHERDVTPVLLDLARTELVEPGESPLVASVCWTLSDLKANGPDVLSALKEILATGESGYKAFEVLASMPAPPDSHVQEAVRLLASDAWGGRAEAVRYLGRVADSMDGPVEVVAAIIQATRDQDPYARLEAAKALGAGYEPLEREAIEALLAALRDHDACVAVAAAESLGRFGARARWALALLGDELARQREQPTASPRSLLASPRYPPCVVAAIAEAIDEIAAD